MNREERRATMRAADKENARWPPVPVEVPRSEWSPQTIPPGLERVWRSKRFLVMLFQVPGHDYPDFMRISVQRVEDAAFRSGTGRSPISWDELQTLKEQIGFKLRMAVEIYPPASQTVNVAPMRHLFVVPSSFLSFAWRPL